MSVASAAGYVQYSDTDISYIPQLFAPSVLVKYYAKSVIPAITNTSYEGVIKNFGDKVTIRTRPDITVKNYTKGMTLEDETPESPPVDLLIDQAKYYSFIIDTVDEKQADIVLSNEFTSDAAEAMRIKVDTDVLGTVYADAHASNQGATAGAVSESYNLGSAGSPVAVSKANVLDYLTMAGTVLDEQNVPENDRWGVLPAWMRYMLMNSDLKNVSVTGDPASTIRNGRIGEIDRLTLYLSNLGSKVADGAHTAYNVMFGQKDAITYAAQLVKNENLRADRKFGMKYRGLQVYGRKVVKPEGLVNLYCRKG